MEMMKKKNFELNSENEDKLNGLEEYEMRMR